MLFSKPSLLPSFLFGFQCPRCAFPRQLLHNITGFFRCQQIFSSFSKLFSDLSASGVFARSSTEVDSKYNIFRQQFQGVCKKFYTIALFSERNGAASVERKSRPCSVRTRRSTPGVFSPTQTDASLSAKRIHRLRRKTSSRRNRDSPRLRPAP